MTAVIRIERLGKSYRVWHQPADMLIETLTGRQRHIMFEALKDISFAIPPGSVTGIIGRNGAGKSTLLRIVAGTLNATAGTVSVEGRIAAILELGTGFAPDYTGRENIYLGGFCLGLKQKEIDRRFDEIVSFAEIGDFIDRPFRTFSSGMQARLTFAVATCVDPDVLIIDEALAVGDARFQVRSFDRVREFKRRGKSILLVSHDMNQITSICDRAILLDKGRVIADGLPQKVCNIYHELLFSPTEAALPAPQEDAATSPAPALTNEMASTELKRPSVMQASTCETFTGASAKIVLRPDRFETGAEQTDHRYGDGAVRIIEFEIRTLDGYPARQLHSLSDYELVVGIQAFRAVTDICYGLLVRDRRGLDLFGWDTLSCCNWRIARLAVGETHHSTVRFTMNLAGGTYFLSLSLARSDGHKYDVRFDALQVDVQPSPNTYATSIVNLNAHEPITMRKQ